MNIWEKLDALLPELPPNKRSLLGSRAIVTEGPYLGQRGDVVVEQNGLVLIRLGLNTHWLSRGSVAQEP